jgi:hypothetical protein
MSLNDLSIKYKLDKNIASGCHNYIPGYTQLFEERRNDVTKVLEIGIGSVENGQMGGVIRSGYKTGNSLKCWSEYFPNAMIYGIDIYSHEELNTDRIKTFQADQSSSTDLETVINKINGSVDIIIDDGSHIGNHQVYSFLFLHKYLSENGMYVIEDIQPQNIAGFKNLSIFPENSISYINDNFNITYFDTRKQIGRADDFMMCFTKKNIATIP